MEVEVAAPPPAAPLIPLEDAPTVVPVAAEADGWAPWPPCPAHAMPRAAHQQHHTISSFHNVQHHPCICRVFNADAGPSAATVATAATAWGAKGSEPSAAPMQLDQPPGNGQPTGEQGLSADQQLQQQPDSDILQQQVEQQVQQQEQPQQEQAQQEQLLVAQQQQQGLMDADMLQLQVGVGPSASPLMSSLLPMQCAAFGWQHPSRPPCSLHRWSFHAAPGYCLALISSLIACCWPCLEGPSSRGRLCP